MKDATIFLGIVIVLALLLSFTLILLMQLSPKSARYIEIVGYVILIISLMWTGFTNVIEDESKDSEY